MTTTSHFNSKNPKTSPNSGTFIQAPSTKNRAQIRLLIFLQCEDSLKELTDYLNSSDDFMINVSTDLSACLNSTVEEAYDAVITDCCDFNLELGINDTIATFKESSKSLAVILLMNSANHLDEIEHLNQGADWVISKPFIGALVIARIKAMMRWKNFSAGSLPQVGPFKFDMETKRLSNPEFGEIRVTAKEALILKFLLSQKGRIVSRTDLLQHVWGYNNSANTHTVETHIYRLRKKIGRVVDSKSIIITEVRGYRLAE